MVRGVDDFRVVHGCPHDDAPGLDDRIVLRHPFMIDQRDADDLVVLLRERKLFKPSRSARGRIGLAPHREEFGFSPLELSVLFEKFPEHADVSHAQVEGKLDPFPREILDVQAMIDRPGPHVLSYTEAVEFVAGCAGLEHAMEQGWPIVPLPNKTACEQSYEPLARGADPPRPNID